MYKRLSAHMDELTYQGQVHGVIYTHGEYFRYKTPLTGRLKAGTHPQRNTRGSIGAGTFVVGTEAAGFIFNAPAAGTKPYRNTIFANQTTHIDAETALNAFGYTNTPAGRIRAGESPQRNTRGQTDGAAVTMGDTAEAYHFTTPAAGIRPGKKHGAEDRGRHRGQQYAGNGVFIRRQAVRKHPEAIKGGEDHVDNGRNQ